VHVTINMDIDPTNLLVLKEKHRVTRA